MLSARKNYGGESASREPKLQNKKIFKGGEKLKCIERFCNKLYSFMPPGDERSRKLKILLKYDYILCLTILLSIYVPLAQGVVNVVSHVTNGHDMVASFLVTFPCFMMNGCNNNTNSCRNNSNSYNFSKEFDYES